MRCLLVDDGKNVLLIDTGIGDKQDEKFTGHFYLHGEDTLKNSLIKLGYSFESITHVLLTHLHFDHAGGAIKIDEKGNFVPAFPNSQYFISQAQWNWAINANYREKASFLSENILPIKESGRLTLLEKEQEIIPNVSVRLYNGHTDGQAIPFIKTDNGQTVVFMADLLPSHAHIPMPWVMSYDTRPLITLEEKEALFPEIVENKYIMVFEHDLYHECATLLDTPKGARADKLGKLMIPVKVSLSI
jgi:glyoxylase-like metal-dependent hydrolase (beta-lactamase superfamily II)